GMVVTDRAQGVEQAQVIFVRHVVAVPGHDVERRVVELRAPQFAKELLHQFGGLLAVLEVRNRRLKVAGIGQPVAANRPEVWQAQGRAVVLADVTARVAVE
nr:hypothetical protein [Tanacetum cinerariifolium]